MIPHDTQEREEHRSESDCLRAFVDDNEELERLESIIDRFNLFAALDVVRVEIRHSSFLRWLLDPNETHGLGDYALSRFLKRIARRAEGLPGNVPSLFDLDGWDLGRAQVLREWRKIDILIQDERNKVVIAIENKVDAAEHSSQLRRYRKVVEREFSGYKKLFVYLTVAGDPPSDEKYVSLSYAEIADLVESLLARRESQIGEEVALFVGQYVEMLRRFIVEESEIQDLCRRIYLNHRRALDLIFEQRPDRAAEIAAVIRGYIESRRDLIVEQSSKTYIRFLPPSLDSFPREGEGWLKSGRMLVWEIENYGQRVRVKLLIGPGPQHLREEVFRKAKGTSGVFSDKRKKLSPKWHSLHAETWIRSGEYDDIAGDDIRERIEKKLPEVKRLSEKLAELVAGIVM